MWKKIERIFQLQWKIENISDMFLQYLVLCGLERKFLKITSQDIASVCIYVKVTLYYGWQDLRMILKWLLKGQQLELCKK